MEIYTGNFANVRKYESAGLKPISIAVSARYFTGTCYRELNPDKSFMHDEEIDYKPKFMQKLSTLNAGCVVEDLEKLSGGKDVVLCCHESAGTFCHRQLVAKWLNEQLGIEILELGKMGLLKNSI